MRLFGSDKPVVIDLPDLHLHLVYEDKRLRVNPGNHSYVFLLNPEEFLRIYREVLPLVPFNFEPTMLDQERIEFTPPERDAVKQAVVLSLMHTHVHHHIPPKITPEEFEHPNRRHIVLWQAEAKYGDASEKALALAASTLKMPVEKFAMWVRVEKERQRLM